MLNLLAQRFKAATIAPRFLAGVTRVIQSLARPTAGVAPLSSSSRSLAATHTRIIALGTTALATTRTGLSFGAIDAKGTTARFPILGARTRGMVAVALTVTCAPRLPIHDTSSTPFGVADIAGSATGRKFMSADALNPRLTIPATRIDAKARVALVLPGVTLVVSPQSTGFALTVLKFDSPLVRSATFSRTALDCADVPPLVDSLLAFLMWETERDSATAPNDTTRRAAAAVAAGGRRGGG